MKSYECEPCGYVYDPAAGDPDNGIAPGTAFENLPEDWVCRSAALVKMNLKLQNKYYIKKISPQERI